MIKNCSHFQMEQLNIYKLNDLDILHENVVNTAIFSH